MTEETAATSSSEVSTANILAGLERLTASCQEMDDRSSIPLGHYQDIPQDIAQSYTLISQGANLVHATSTKYTLMGKISADEAAKVAQDLLKGCQFIATGAMVIGTDNYGCSRSTRHYTKRAVRAVLTTVTQLVETFVSATHGHEEILEKDNNLAAQKCGAVWSTCEVFMKKKLPQGNRNAMRRDLFTWMMECNETMEEFQELIDKGPDPRLETITEGDNGKSTTTNNGEDNTTMPSFEEFLCQGNDEQYTAKELEIAKPAVNLVKCSRGSINVALKAIDSAGQRIDDSMDKTKKEQILAFVQNVHDLARAVGEGMTDLGTLLYPTISIDDMEQQGSKQTAAISALLDHVLDAEMELDEEILEMVHKIKPAAQKRHDELTDAIAAARS